MGGGGWAQGLGLRWPKGFGGRGREGGRRGRQVSDMGQHSAALIITQHPTTLRTAPLLRLPACRCVDTVWEFQRMAARGLANETSPWFKWVVRSGQLDCLRRSLVAVKIGWHVHVAVKV